MVYEFATLSGSVAVDHEVCKGCENKACVPACPVEILKLGEAGPVLAISEQEAARGACVECLSCAQECLFQGLGALTMELPIPGLAEWRASYD